MINSIGYIQIKRFKYWIAPTLCQTVRDKKSVRRIISTNFHSFSIRTVRVKIRSNQNRNTFSIK